MVYTVSLISSVLFIGLCRSNLDQCKILICPIFKCAHNARLLLHDSSPENDETDTTVSVSSFIPNGFVNKNDYRYKDQKQYRNSGFPPACEADLLFILHRNDVLS